MPTLLQCISEFVDKISVTDRQEESILSSISNIETHLLDSENNLDVKRIFTNGSYERDTILRPLDDIDIFAVLDRQDYEDEYHNLCTPQTILSKFNFFLDSTPDYAGKVKQDRPCVTVRLSDKNFDVLPSFEEETGGYLIPNYDLKSWTYSYPERLTTDLNSIHRTRNYKVKPIIKAVKYWNRSLGKVIPSYHIEETAISIFTVNNFVNLEEGIRLWFNNAEYYLKSTTFQSHSDYSEAIVKVKEAKTSINEASKAYSDGLEGEAIKVWKLIFGRDFPTVDLEEAKRFSAALTEGALKVTTTGAISTSIGRSIPSTKGYYGEISE